MTRRRLPIGIQTFREICEDGCYYVDKTAHVRRLLDEGKHFFLSRSRRFGKRYSSSSFARRSTSKYVASCAMSRFASGARRSPARRGRSLNKKAGDRTGQARLGPFEQLSAGPVRRRSDREPEQRDRRHHRLPQRPDRAGSGAGKDAGDVGVRDRPGGGRWERGVLTGRASSLRSALGVSTDRIPPLLLGVVSPPPASRLHKRPAARNF